MEDLTKALIGVGTLIVLTAIGGGAMGKAVISALRSLLEAALKNMEANTSAIRKNTEVTAALVQQINTFVQVQAQKDSYIHEQLVATHDAALAAKDASAALSEKLRGRL